MSFWDKVKSAFSGGGSSSSSSSSSTKKKSSGRGSAGGSTTASVATDIKMGMATFGQSYDKAAETLAAKGYSPKAIDSYISRTQETQKKAQASMMTRNKDRDNTPAPAPDIPYKQTTAPGFTGEPPVRTGSPGLSQRLRRQFDSMQKRMNLPKNYLKPKADTTGKTEGAAAPVEPDTGAGTTTAQAGVEEAAIIKAEAKGPAEAAVADTAKKGRRSTIETTPQGLLAPAKTRKRRSLMGGLIA